MIYRYNSQRYYGQKMSYILNLEAQTYKLSTQTNKSTESHFCHETMRPERVWIRLENQKKVKIN